MEKKPVGVVNFIEIMRKMEDAGARRMTFSLSKKEQAKADRWMKQHRKIHGYGKDGASGGRWSFEFTPTGLGTVVIVKCACGKQKDLTDFSNW
jgi:hypothetical protein